MEDVSSLAIGYGGLSLCTTLLHNVFLLYHVEMFVSIYRISKWSFWVGESIFLVWNCINDPLFGWISDSKFLTGSDHSDPVLKRLGALRRAGPLLALSFFMLWFSWGWPLVQLVLGLCLYDSFLTLVDLHHSALLAELAISQKARASLNTMCAVFGAIGSFSVFLSYFLWNKASLGPFKFLCLILVCTTSLGYFFFSSLLSRNYKTLFKREISHQDNIVTNDERWEEAKKLSTKEALYLFGRQLTRQKNFLCFSCLNLIQVFHCHFNSNFFPLFIDVMLGQDLSRTACALLLGVSFMAPHINNIVLLWLSKRHTLYDVLRGLFILKLFLAVLMLVVGYNHTTVLVLYIASNRVFTEGTCKLLTLVISDLVDEDAVLHARPRPLSALIFGTTALLAKPGQTLAPLIGTWLLAMQTGVDLFRLDSDLKLSSFQESHALRTGCFWLLVYVPLLCGVLQLLAWSRFSLRGSRLARVKASRQQQHSLGNV